MGTPTARTPPDGPGGPGGPRTPANGTDGSGPVFPSPEEFAEAVAEWIVASISAGLEKFIDTFNRVMFGLPTPGAWENPDSWVDPTNGWWAGVWETYLILVPIGVFMGVSAATLALSKPPAERRQRFLTAAKALGLIVFGFPFLAAVLHLGNALSIALAPAPEEFLSTPGNTAKLGVGVVLVVVGGAGYAADRWWTSAPDRLRNTLRWAVRARRLPWSHAAGETPRRWQPRGSESNPAKLPAEFPPTRSDALRFEHARGRRSNSH